MNNNFYCVIMAGGVGSRFWPMSRNAKPKQFLDILGIGRTFLQLTYDRFAKIVPKENILVVTSEAYGDLVRQQLPEIISDNVLTEPYRRNTAPCITYAATKILSKNPNATMVVAPSDHFIANEALFLETIESALQYASQKDYLFTLGIEPTRPETGYGYIQMSVKDAITVDGHIAYPVKTFTEKPDKDMAKIFIDSGEFLWNSGIFIWQVQTICKALGKWLPEVYSLFAEGYRYYGTDQEKSFVDKVYGDCPAISIDYGVMEKTLRAWVFQASFGWSDLGTWDSIFIHSAKDKDNNVTRCPEQIVDRTQDSIIISQEKDKLVIVKDLKGYMVVNTDDVLMICPREDSKFKEVLTELATEEKSKYM